MEENRTLLIVDDEPETLKGYQEFLTPKETAAPRRTSRRLYGTGNTEVPKLENYNLLVASSGEEAIKIFENEMKQGRRVAAGFFDVKLEGGMDGLATIHAIKSMDKDIHCVVVTAYHDRTVEEINQLFGEDFKDQWDYLNKPFTQGEIIQKARQMVAAWNRKRQLELMHAQLLRSERMTAIAQVARGIGHEFGNILLRIIGKTDLALMEESTERIKEHLKVIMTASERAGLIVRNLQSFSKAEPRLQDAMLTESIDEALTLVNHELVKASVTADKKYDAVKKQKIDVGAMAQVFLNLFINATHAMPNGGKISIHVKEMASPENKPGAAAIVSDTGTGIPAEIMSRIFDFAFTTKGDRGSGLGLSVSKEIVEAHAGKISVTSEVGKGTQFTIWLPYEH